MFNAMSTRKPKIIRRGSVSTQTTKTHVQQLRDERRKLMQRISEIDKELEKNG